MTEKSPVLNEILMDMDRRGKIPWSRLSGRVQTVLMDIMTCHTAVHGFSASRCTVCGAERLHFGSCNNPCCPSCGLIRREMWLDKQRAKAFNAPAFHVVFTVPDGPLHDLFRAEPEFMYKAMFQAQEKALKILARDPKFLGAEKTGFFSTLHSWGSALNFHPHIHVLFYGAGLNRKGELVVADPHYLFPVKKLAETFRRIFLTLVCSKFEVSNSPWLRDIQKARYSRKWNVEIREKYNTPDDVIKYLGRYMGRVAISNGRIRSHSDGKVTFTYKDYRAGGKIRLMSLDENTFLERFISHIPPAGFARTRYYGFLSNNSSKALEKIKKLTNTETSFVPRTKEEILEEAGLKEKTRCQKCGGKTDRIDLRSEKKSERRHKRSSGWGKGTRYRALRKWVMDRYTVSDYLCTVYGPLYTTPENINQYIISLN